MSAEARNMNIISIYRYVFIRGSKKSIFYESTVRYLINVEPL